MAHPTPSRPTPLSSPALIGLMKTGRARQNRAEQPASPPTDCVVALPSISADTVELIGFDARGNARIRVEIPATEDVELWETWLLRWVRRRFPSMTLIG